MLVNSDLEDKRGIRKEERRKTGHNMFIVLSI
jgi:hypothetical protein